MNTLKTELSILVSMMPDDELMNLGLAELTQEHFVDERTKIIFSKMSDIHSQGRQCTLENTAFPSDLYESAMVGGILELREFKNTCEDLLNWKSCRDLMSMADMIKAIAQGGNFKRAFEYNVNNIGKIHSSKDYMAFVGFDVAADRAEKRILDLQKPGGVDKYYISSGYKEIDRIYMGLPMGLTIIAADSGEGKSTVVLPTILANSGRDIFIASTEVSPEGVSANLASIKADIYRSDIVRGKIMGKELEAYIRVLRDIIAKIKGGVTMQRRLSRIISEMKLWRANTDRDKLGIVVVDFLTDIFDDNGNTYADDKLIRNAISVLKGLSKELNVAMIVLCQFNSLRKSRKDKTPNRGDIYGSASVYNSADVVIYPYRPVMWLPEKEKHYYEGKRYEDCFFIIDKFKENGLNKIPMIMDCWVTQFKDVEKRAVTFGSFEQLLPITAEKLNTEFEISIRK